MKNKLDASKEVLGCLPEAQGFDAFFVDSHCLLCVLD